MSFLDAKTPVLVTTNRIFEKIDGQRFLFFYESESASGAGACAQRPDAQGDAELSEMFLSAPYDFSNAEQMARYANLVMRPRCELRVHERQAEARELAALEIGEPLAAECLMMAYRFDRPCSAEPRSAALFEAQPGLSLALFDTESYEPQGRAEILWHKGTNRVGLVAVRRAAPIDDQD